jgi:hypothetical protein
MKTLSELLERWDSGDGKPYKGSLIDWSAFEADKSNIGCMCAQGQVLHLLGGWSPGKLRDVGQAKADEATAKLLNISIAHSILLRSVNDKADGAPSIVLTHPEKVLGDQAQTVLAFWLHLDGIKAKDWQKVTAAGAAARDAAFFGDAAGAAARDAAGAAAGAAARDAARAAAWAAAGAAARDAARAAARAAAWAAARDVAGACSEIQGSRILREKGQAFFFLPLFGLADPESIPVLPADYGRPA